MRIATSTPTTVVGYISNDNEEKADFAKLIRPFSDVKLARAAEVSTETVRTWKVERSFPNGRHLIRLMEEFPKVNAWVNRRAGGINNPQSLSEGMAYVEKIMAGNTPDSRAMKARLQQLMAEGK